MTRIQEKPFPKKLNQRGQGLVEYLIIVALMGVATIAVVRVMGATVSNRFAHVTNALQGNPTGVKAPAKITNSLSDKKDLNSFFKGTGSEEKD